MTSSTHTSTAVDDLDLSGLASLHPVIPHAVMYTLPQCPNCDRLKTLFKAAKLPVVAVTLEHGSTAHTLFGTTLQVKQTPIVLVHNTFDRPTYFSGFDSSNARRVTKAILGRLQSLADSGQLGPVEDYLAALIANIEPGQSHPFIEPATYAGLAARHSPHRAPQAPQCNEPAPLSATTPLLAAEPDTPSPEDRDLVRRLT